MEIAMRIILATIILTMLAHPVWASAEESCKVEWHYGPANCLRTCEDILVFERILNILDRNSHRSSSAVAIERKFLIEIATEEALSEAITYYGANCKRYN